MIDVGNLTKYFGPVLAVDRISFQIGEGEIVGFLGPNGAGKSTTIRILTSFLPATSGVARVAGHDVLRESMEVRKSIGYLPESVPLYTEMRVEEYLHYRARIKGVDRKGRMSRIEHCLERCRIREVRRRLIGTLSKGYRQRVGLADAMVHDPPILILDEPTVGLDPLQIRETLALIKALGVDRTILLSTHILSEVEAVCRRVVIICSGRIALDRKLSELSGDESQIVVEAHGPVEQVAASLRALEGVRQVTGEDLGQGTARCQIQTRPDEDLRETISQRLTSNGWPIRRLDVKSRGLEDQFIDVVARDVRRRESAEGSERAPEPPPASAPAPPPTPPPEPPAAETSVRAG